MSRKYTNHLDILPGRRKLIPKAVYCMVTHMQSHCVNPVKRSPMKERKGRTISILTAVTNVKW